MAAPLRCMTFCRFSSKLLKNSTIANLTAISKCSTNAEETIENLQKLRMEREMKEEYEREVARLRDVSNLGKVLTDRHRGQLPKEVLGTDKFTSSRKFYRKMYAAYGAASGLDPSKLWPSKEEMQSMIEDDKYWEPSYKETVTKIQAVKEEKEREAVERDIKIEKAMQNMDKLIKDYKKRVENAAQQEKKSSALNIRLLSEFRDKYGYSVPEKSFRFKEFKRARFEEDKWQKKKDKKQTKLDLRKKALEGPAEKEN